jgi:hypothetical protein
MNQIKWIWRRNAGTHKENVLETHTECPKNIYKLWMLTPNIKIEAEL